MVYKTNDEPNSVNPHNDLYDFFADKNLSLMYIRGFPSDLRLSGTRTLDGGIKEVIGLNFSEVEEGDGENVSVTRAVKGFVGRKG